jgi:hypothetical protein
MQELAVFVQVADCHEFVRELEVGKSMHFGGIKLRTAGFEDIDSPLEMLRAMIARFVHTPSAVAGGCPLMKTAIDADDGNETLRGMVRDAFKVWLAA